MRAATRRRYVSLLAPANCRGQPALAECSPNQAELLSIKRAACTLFNVLNSLAIIDSSAFILAFRQFFTVALFNISLFLLLLNRIYLSFYFVLFSCQTCSDINSFLHYSVNQLLHNQTFVKPFLITSKYEPLNCLLETLILSNLVLKLNYTFTEII